MLINNLANIISWISSKLFSLISIPAIPEEVRTAIFEFFELVFDNLSLLGLFVDIDLLKKLCAMALIVFATEKIIIIFRFLYNKLPFIKV